MIDQATGIDVTVRPYGGGSSYYEYLAPRQSPFFTGKPNERYIEAVTGEQFEINIELPANFDFKKCSHVQLSLLIDGRAGALCIFPAKSDFIEGEAYTHLFDCDYKKVDDRYEGLGFTFAAAKILEEPSGRLGEKQRRDDDRGKIEVWVQLGNYKDLPGNLGHFPGRSQPLEMTKKVAVDNGKSHSMQYVPMGETDNFDDGGYKWTPARGSHGKVTAFTFFYASRMILEIKKIMPTFADTSSTSQTPEVPSRTKHAPGKPKQQAKDAEAPRKGGCADEDDEEIIITPAPPKTQIVVDLEADDDNITAVSPTVVGLQRIKREGTGAPAAVDDGRAAKRIKREETESATGRRASNATPATTMSSETSSAQSAKVKEKARLNMQLEELKIREEKLKISRRLAELNEE